MDSADSSYDNDKKNSDRLVYGGGILAVIQLVINPF